MQEIVVTVSKDGSTKISVNGVSGPGCQKLSESIEKSLGKTVTTELTSEYYQESEKTELQAGQQ